MRQLPGRARFAMVAFSLARLLPAQYPDPLTLLNGMRVTDVQTWMQKRRPELLHLFEDYVFGRTMAGRPKEMTWEVVAEDRHGMGGSAFTKTVKLYFAGAKSGPSMELVFTLPITGKPVPVFLVAGNARFNPKPVLDRGYGIVACRIDQIQADAPTGYANSIRAYLAPPGRTEPAAGEWGAIGAWAWGLSRAMDYIETDADIDAKKVSLNGYSRYAKVAMWAGAQDQRFAMTFSAEPGFDETLGSLAHGRFSYWFVKRPNESLPVGWHELIALHAPRPVYIAAAEEDFLAAKYAEPVYKMFGVGDFIGYHTRKGEPGQDQYDWNQYLNFADRHMKKP